MLAVNARRAVLLVAIMLLASASPLLAISTASSHGGSVTNWGSGGSNDTGWIRIDATGADQSLGQNAVGTLNLDFAPGAEISNLTFEVRVDGANGLWVDQPQLILPDSQASLIDWRGLGGFGQLSDFVGDDPHVGRLNPNSDANAGWVLPGGVNVTDVIIEALRPADPLVSMVQIDVDIRSYATHPDDGRLYVSVGDAIVQIDANNDPPMIEIDSDVNAYDIVVDVGFGHLIAATESGELRMWSLDDSSEVGSLSIPSGVSKFTSLAVFGPGSIWASDAVSLYQGTYAWNTNTQSFLTTWVKKADLATGIDGMASTMLLISGDVYVGTMGGGVYFYDDSANSVTEWSTQNTLPSDYITSLTLANTYLLIGTADAGVARRDIATGNWLATWNDGNWLASNAIHSLSTIGGWTHILAGDTVHAYNTSSLSFVRTHTMSSLQLNRDDGSDLIAWPSGGSRSPANNTVLVGDASGLFAELEPDSNNPHVGEILMATGPSENEMRAVVQIGNIVYIAAGDGIERFDTHRNRWLAPFSTGGSAALSLATDGSTLFVGTDGTGVQQFAADGTMLLHLSIQDGMNSDDVNHISFDQTTGFVIAGHSQAGLSVIDPTIGTVNQTWATGNGLQSNQITGLTARYGVAYAGTFNAGVQRIDLVNSTTLTAWSSTGADDVESAPIVVDGTTMYLGLYGFGVFIYDLNTGEITDKWVRTGGGGGNQNRQIPSNEVRSLMVESSGNILVGTSDGAARHNANGWAPFGNSGNQNANEFNDFELDSQYIYTATNTGVCQYSRSNLAYQGCWDDDPDGLPGEYTFSVRMIQPDRLYVGTYEGAGVIDIANDTVIHSWEAGVQTENAKTVVIGDIAYIGYNGLGVLRYDILNDTWLAPWDSTTNLLDSNGVTALVQDINPSRIWVGGDMGLNLIDVGSATLVVDWDDGGNSGGVTLPQTSPGELVIIGDTMHYSMARSGQWESNDYIYRYDIVNLTQKSTIDAGASEGYTAFVHGIGAVGDVLHIGISPTQWWNGDGHLVMWDTTTEQWLQSVASDGQVLRVNAQYAGECYPIPTNCHLYASYGDTPLHKVDMNGNLVASWNSSVIEGPIRGIETWGNTVLFATEDGVARYDFINNTWLSTWSENNGLPNNVEDAVFSMEVVGNDLWIASMTTGGGWQRNSKISVLNGTTGNWQVFNAGSGQIPQGYGADIGVCYGIVHVAMGRTSGFGSQGGVARYDMRTHSWLSDWTMGQGGLPDDDVFAIGCDENYQVAYIGFNNFDGQIARYNYHTNNFLTLLDDSDGVIGEPVFPGAMEHSGSHLYIGHMEGGGITRIATTGALVTGIVALDVGTEANSIALVPGTNPPAFAIGRAGGASGYNRVDHLSLNGLIPGAWDVLATLSTGRIGEFAGNSTHVWVLPIDDYWSEYGSAVLEGLRMPNGTIEWTRAWNFNAEVASEIMLDGDVLWVTTNGWGMLRIDLTTGQVINTIGLHWAIDGMAWHGTDMVVGLMGTAATAAGVQMFDTTNMQWGNGKLVAGLPSNFVRDFGLSGNHVYIATMGGLGVWNLTSDEWDDPITTADGLPTPVLNYLEVDDGTGTLIIGTPIGIVQYQPGQGVVGSTLGRAQGLVGDDVSGFARVGSNTSSYNLYVSHGGTGPTRPGATSTIVGQQQPQAGVQITVLDTYLVDMLPSNEVTAIASDWWGVHIATTEQPLMHWDGAASEMEQGISSWGVASWPISQLSSDGTNLLALTTLGLDLIDVQSSAHSSTPLVRMPGLVSGYIDSNGVWVAAEEGLFAWSGAPSFQALDRAVMRRAEPLQINFGGESHDVTEQARPGNRIYLVNSSNPISIPNFGTSGPGNIPLTQDMLTITSPVDGAATWASSVRVNYSGSWDLAALDSNFLVMFQNAIDSGSLSNMGRAMQVQLQSPRDGALEIRLTYDWVRSESPSEMIDLYDRPDDGGSVLVAEWTVTQDHSFAAYRLYLREGSNWTSPPTSADLLSESYAARIPDWTRTTVEIDTLAGFQLSKTTPYWAVVAIEYPDGSIGEPSAPFGPATPTDEIPMPPEWAEAGPSAGGADGDLYVEWAACISMDIFSTRMWASPDLITDAVGLAGELDLAHSQGNSTVLILEEGRPYWIALTCVDESGQHDPANATIIGPVVPTGGLNDWTPPAPIANIDAFDTPEDEGGRITVTWSPNEEEDCAWYTIYISEQVTDSVPDNATSAEISTIISDCAANGTIITEIGGVPLVDGRPYWITVVAADKWGNEDLLDVTWVNATSIQDNSGGIDPPPRVENLAAWDHPDDDGTAIDVEWMSTNVDDFSFYVVWTSEHSVADVAMKWVECEDDPAACGLLVIRQQRHGLSEMMRVNVTTALYGDSLADSTASPISPGEPLWVTVTIHDVKGHAFLTRLSDNMVQVTPVDNRGDVIPPDRLGAPEVWDRPDDSGDGLMVKFALSSASDLDHYAVYADTIPVDDVTGREPAKLVDRNVDGPIEIEMLSNGQRIDPGVQIWVTVVPVDSSGNGWLTDLSSAYAIAIDDSLTDPGLHLPEVTGVKAKWTDDGEGIIVSWEASDDPQVRSYFIFISESPYEDIRSAIMAEDRLQSTRFQLGQTIDENYSNNQSWYIGVVAFDGDVHRFGVDPYHLLPYEPPADVEGDGSGEGEASQWWEAFSSFELVAISLLSLMIILLSLVLVIRLRKPRFDPLDHATPNWELQGDDWADGGLSENVDFAATLLPAAESITSVTTAPQVKSDTAPAPPIPADVHESLDDLAADLLVDSPKKDDEVDTSFLDDLL